MLEAKAVPAPLASADTAADVDQTGSESTGGLEPSEAGTADSANGDIAVTQIGGDGAPPSYEASTDAVGAASTGESLTQITEGSTPLVDTGLAGAVDTLAGVVQVGGSEASLIVVGPPGIDVSISVETGAASMAGNGELAGGQTQAVETHPAVAAVGGTSASETYQPDASPSQRSNIALANFLSDAPDPVLAPLSPRNGAKLIDAASEPIASGPTTVVPSLASVFAALQPAPPNLQKWLDSWFGPSARARVTAREDATTPSAGDEHDRQPPTEQETAPQDPPVDIPLEEPSELRPAEALTPEEIARGYEEIAAWLEANPGIEPGIAGTGGSAPVKSYFGFIGAGFDGHAGIGRPAGFGESPGMAVIGGDALQPLRGIAEGYTPLGLA